MVFQAVDRCPARWYQSDFHFLPGGLFFYLKLALVCGVLLAMPVIFYQVWRFVAPGLYAHEKKTLLPFTLLSSICFLGGAAFGYFIVFPPAFRFLVGFSSDLLDPMPVVSEYFSLCLRLLLAFGVIFELPVLMVFLARIGVIDVARLNRYRKYAVLVNFVIAAILTPTPDVVNQLLMAVPLMVLYEIGVVAVWLLGKRSQETKERAEKTDDSGQQAEDGR
jgi:sec-independent protein translocase protein TatC